jgi:ATP-dependent DNA helicase RecG
MMSLPDALRTLHRPPPTLQLSELESGKHPAQRRLILEELLAHNLSMLALRAGAQRYHALALSANDTLKDKLLASSPLRRPARRRASRLKSSAIWRWTCR